MGRNKVFSLGIAATFLIVLQAILLLPQQPVRAVAGGYLTNDTMLRIGMAVSLSTDQEGVVERASQETQHATIGIATTIDGSLVTVANSTAQVLVETHGEVDVYITDIGGEVKRGDLLTVSPFKGVLMKAGSGGSIIGVAASDIDFTSADPYELADASTDSAKIAKGRLSLNSPSLNREGDQTKSALERLGLSITGKEVSEVRMLVALVIFIVVLIAEGGIIYGAISSSVTALGRNPLAGKMIHRELIRVILVAVTVLVLGILAVFAVLRV